MDGKNCVCIYLPQSMSVETPLVEGVCEVLSMRADDLLVRVIPYGEETSIRPDSLTAIVLGGKEILTDLSLLSVDEISGTIRDSLEEVESRLPIVPVYARAKSPALT